MSERIKAIKDLQDWVRKAPMCDNCKSFTFSYRTLGNVKGTWQEKYKFTCRIGGFATKPFSICKKWNSK